MTPRRAAISVSASTCVGVRLLHRHRSLDALRALAEDGTLSLCVAGIMPARDAARAHQRLAAGGVRGRLVLEFEVPLA
jgi:hypothetical protein